MIKLTESAFTSGQGSLWVLVDAFDMGWKVYGGKKIHKIALLLCRKTKKNELKTFVREITIGNYKINYEWTALMYGLSGTFVEQNKQYEWDTIVHDFIKDVRSHTYNLYFVLSKHEVNGKKWTSLDHLKVLHKTLEQKTPDMKWRDRDIQKYGIGSTVDIPETDIMEDDDADNEKLENQPE